MGICFILRDEGLHNRCLGGRREGEKDGKREVGRKGGRDGGKGVHVYTIRAAVQTQLMQAHLYSFNICSTLLYLLHS